MTLRFIEQRARLPRLGIIRLGIKTLSAGGKEIPREVDYFVLPEDLVGLFDGRPKKLPVMFPFDEVDHVLQAAYEKRSGPTLSLRCNSQFYTTWDERGKASTGPCRKAEVEDAVPCPCGAVAKGHLNVIVPQGSAGGVYWVLIGGEQRLADLWSELSIYRERFGRLKGIVFELERVSTQVTIVTDKGRMSRTGWPVKIRCAVPAMQALSIRGVEVRALPGGQVMGPAALTEGEGEAAPDETNGVHEPIVGSHEPTAGSPIAPPVAGEQAAPSLVEGHKPPPNEMEVPPDSSPLVGAIPSMDEGALETPLSLSICCERAKKAGLTDRAYRIYLRSIYGVKNPETDLSPAEVRDQVTLWDKAVNNPKAQEALKGAILAAVNKALKKGA